MKLLTLAIFQLNFKSGSRSVNTINDPSQKFSEPEDKCDTRSKLKERIRLFDLRNLVMDENDIASTNRRLSNH